MDSSDFGQEPKYVECPLCTILSSIATQLTRLKSPLGGGEETVPATSPKDLTTCKLCGQVRTFLPPPAESAPTMWAGGSQNDVEWEETVPKTDPETLGTEIHLFVKIKVSKMPQLLPETPRFVSLDGKIAQNLEKKAAQKRAAEAALPAAIPKKRRHRRARRSRQDFLNFDRQQWVQYHPPAGAVKEEVIEAPKPTPLVASGSEPPRRPNNFEKPKGECETSPVKCTRPMKYDVAQARAVAVVKTRLRRSLPKSMKNVPEGLIQLGSREHYIERLFPREYRNCMKYNIPLSEAFPE